MHTFFASFKNLIFYLVFPIHLVATDISIVGYIMPEDGLGKIPVNIIEILDKDISFNVISTDFKPPLKDKLPDDVVKALNNPDKSPGKIAILTEPINNRVWGGAIHMPSESLIKISYSMFETDRIPRSWINILNEKFDAVVVPDNFLLKTYKDCGVNIPIFVLPIAMKLDAFFSRPIRKKSSSDLFTFGDASANKNPEVLIKAFAKAFGKNPNVKLIMRAESIHNITREVFDRLIAEYDLKNITLEENHLSLENYIDKLMSFDCYVNLSRGEGFSFIPREALALGIPVIITNNTALTTICESGFVKSISCNQKVNPLPVYDFLFGNDIGHQFDCTVDDAASALLEVYENYEKYVEKAIQGRQWVEQYDCKNLKLKAQYQALFKPKKVVLGDTNALDDGTLTTTSKELYQKYLRLQGNP